MVKFTITIKFEEGLHARPAADLVKVCQKIKSDIKMSKDGMDINPKSILGILTLGANYNDEIVIEVSGDDEAVGAENIRDFFTYVY